ncbi:sulfate adenylyltransferase subunit CysN [Gallionella capsiferriformans]|jgi:sulfate adenylyltransferase subunit 1|uniref:sulfate adenylyltransferase n=1 Tax=Gallionella capsiferriformans (strain ES-2) TaxID=395494 RepID=D9SHI6_GALCS|nr:sulfate adenylyltransferase subunit CysN [Gallionella capsiferriformans]ADL55983.1 sulfate adenylyltransferase, large subunit [Gallionella capsiferriformans ES-2]
MTDTTQLLRFITAGSVDDGKSTLIGRLLHDSKSIFEDQYSAISKTSEKRGMAAVDLSLLTDGLQAEREQGITIDVAYRYFATPKRKFIIGDTPGHEQYTRNMVTAASTANLVVILIDARRGVLVQTRRHTYLASLVGIPHIVLAVNKMDMVEYSEARFNEICTEYLAFAAQLGLHNVTCVPLSALVGDMLVDRGENLAWYQGPTLMELLENVEIDHDVNTTDFRYPVQWVCRPQTEEYHDFRGFMGRIEAGSVSVGDEITVLPAGRTSRVKEIVTLDGNLETACAPQSICITLADEIDISRGDMFVKADYLPAVTKEFDAMLCWLSETPLDKNRKYLVKHTTRTAKCLFSSIDYRVDVNTLEQHANPVVNMNDIAHVKLKVQLPLVTDHYKRNRASGSFIVIDEATNNTVAAGMIC